MMVPSNFNLDFFGLVITSFFRFAVSLQNCLWGQGNSRYISYFHRGNGALKKNCTGLCGNLYEQINNFKCLGQNPDSVIRSNSSLK